MKQFGFTLYALFQSILHIFEPWPQKLRDRINSLTPPMYEGYLFLSTQSLTEHPFGLELFTMILHAPVGFGAVCIEHTVAVAGQVLNGPATIP